MATTTTPNNNFANDAYTWSNLSGWKSYRTLRPFRGIYHDIRRRLPYYLSDLTDGLNYRTLAGTIRIFFVNLLPAIAFTLDMQRRTDHFYGINEGLFASALAAAVFSVFAAQPLTVVGVTGLISLFNYTTYDICQRQGIGELYPEFMAWVAIWAAVTHWITAVCNWCDYMRYITDFSTNSFGMYVSIIYMIKGVEELVANFDEDGANPAAAGYLGIIIALCFWATVWWLEGMGNTTLGRSYARKLLSDYAYPIATIFWTGFSHIPGRIKDADLPRVPQTRAFYPSTDRSWLIEFWTLEARYVFAALPIGVLLTLLFYYDHNVSSLTAQARQFPLKKPAGFHWDFFLLGITCFVGGIIGIPLPNGLIPQAPVHTDSLTEYSDTLTITKEKSCDDDSDSDSSLSPSSSSSSWQIHHRKKIIPLQVREQRLSHILMTLGLIGVMTGPLLTVLHTMPLGLFGGVFFVVGFAGIPTFNITQNLLYCLSESRFTSPTSDPRHKLSKRRILYYTSFQIVGVAISIAISQTIAAIGFPVIITALIPLRWIVLPRIFTERELLVLDGPTADADVVLCSMGGQPERPEVRLAREKRGNQGVEGGRQEGGGGAGGGAGAGDEEDGTGTSSGFISEKGNKTGGADSGSGGGMRSRDRFGKDEEEVEEEEREKRREAEGIHPTAETGHA